VEKMKNIILLIAVLSFSVSIFANNALDFVDPIQYIEVSNMNNTFENSGTFSVWINPFSADYNGRIAFQENDWEIYTSNQNDKFVGVSFVKYYANAPLIVSTENIVPKKEWSHVAVSFDGKNAVIYINGEKVEQTVISNADGKVVNTHNENLLIGNSGSFQSFDGQIDEIRIWNVQRNQTQIKDNMNYNIEAKENGLVGYWKFDEAEGNVSFDETSNRNNANLVNFNAGTSWIASEIELSEREETLRVTNNNYNNEQNVVLFQNSPNPMRTNTNIKFQIKTAAACELNVYNAKGEKVANLFNDQVQNDEVVTVSWNGKDNTGRDVAAGFYLYKIKAGRYTSTKKMILMK